MSNHIERAVKIVRLQPFRAASFYGFGKNPEEQAYAALYAWLESRGEQIDPAGRVFGFNNPNPTVASSNYGYEVWLTIGQDISPEADMRVIGFSGGLYAVMHVENITSPSIEIPEAWKQLYLWMEDSPYRFGSHQWLEEDLRRPGYPPEGKWDMTLHLPVIGAEPN